MMPPIPGAQSYQIRPFQTGDESALYDVCLKTGNAGQDASALYEDRDILGHIYVGPYLYLEPQFALVLEDHQGICGYALGALNSASFYQAYVERWLPKVRRNYPKPIGDPKNWTPTQILINELHYPNPYFPEAFQGYPSHLHIDLVDRAQGKGHGTAMMLHLLKELHGAGSKGVHLGMSPENSLAERFYKKLGFTELARCNQPGRKTLYLCRPLPA